MTLRTPLATAFSAFSTLGIIPLLTMPPALSAAYDSAVISRMSVVSSSGSRSTPLFSKQKTSSVGAIRAAPSATDEVIESPRSLVIPEAANREISAQVVLKRLLEGSK